MRSLAIRMTDQLTMFRSVHKKQANFSGFYVPVDIIEFYQGCASN